IPMVPATAQAGTINGMVTNAVDNTAIVGASIKFYRGINFFAVDSTLAPAPDFVAATGGGGSYTIPSLPQGTYTYVITANNYVSTFGVLGVLGGAQPLNTFLSPTFVGNGMRIVLRWGDC